MIIVGFLRHHPLRVLGTIVILIVYAVFSGFLYYSIQDADAPEGKFFALLTVWTPLFGGLAIGHIWQGVGHKRFGIPLLGVTGAIFGGAAYLAVMAVHPGGFGDLYPDRLGPILFYRIICEGTVLFFWILGSLPAYLRPLLFGWLKENPRVSDGAAKGLATVISKGLPGVVAVAVSFFRGPLRELRKQKRFLAQ